MALFRAFGALTFVIGVALLALDGARSFKQWRFEATSLEHLWINLGADHLFHLRHNFSLWFGGAAEQVLGLPAAFIVFGLGLALLLIAGNGPRDKPIAR